MSPVVTVRVPATSANLGPGFDSLGLALGRYDEISVQPLDVPGVELDVQGEGAGDVPRDATHLVVRSMYAALDNLGVARPGLSVQCRNSIPHGRGLGSSAAAIVSGVLAAHALAQVAPSVDNAAALALASELEGHPDNVAACLLGGLTIAWTDADGAHAARLDPSPAVTAVVFIPGEALATATARAMLPATVPHSDAAHSAGRAALLVEAISRRPDLLLAATEDRLHQRYRAPAMPATASLVDRLRTAGIPAVVSGAGPTVLALVAAGNDALASGKTEVEEIAGASWQVQRLPLDLAGATVHTSERVG